MGTPVPTAAYVPDSSLKTYEAPTPNQRKRRADDNKKNEATKMEIYSSILSCLQQPTVVDPTNTFGKYVAETLKAWGFGTGSSAKLRFSRLC